MVLAVSSISSERGTVADSVLSRGISRYQYFLAKWHARLVVVTVTFAVLSSGGRSWRVTSCSGTIRNPDLSFTGGLAAVLTVCALLAVIVSWGVTIGALSNGTMLGITVFWLVLYGSGFLLSLLPEPWPSPERMLGRLKFVMQGQYNTTMLTQLLAMCGALR